MSGVSTRSQSSADYTIAMYEFDFRQAQRLTRNRHRVGRIAGAFYQAQDALAPARLAHVQAIVSLNQALGGGWLPRPVVEAPDAR